MTRVLCPLAWTVGACALLAAHPVHADYYSYVDDQGVLHLTNIKAAQHTVYRGPDIEGFGGQPPKVVIVKGAQRTVYPVNVTRFDDVFRRAAEHYNLPFEFVKAVAKVESNFNPRALSKANAKGLMQLIDATAADMNVADPYDPEQNVFGGARYLRILANMFDGDLTLTAAAYNAGPHRVKRSNGVPRIRETQRYVAAVRKMYAFYRRSGWTRSK